MDVARPNEQRKHKSASEEKRKHPMKCNLPFNNYCHSTTVKLIQSLGLHLVLQDGYYGDSLGNQGNSC